MAGVLDRIAEYYSRRLRLHGATPKSVNGSSEQAQDRRFTELLRVCNDDRAGSIIDFGCGYGALAARLRRDGFTGDYQGYDLSRDMVVAAADLHGHLDRVAFTADQTRLQRADYTLASGIFNVRLDIPTVAWERHIRETIDYLAELSAVAFAFNMPAMSQEARAGRDVDELYYGDPAHWLTHCLRRFPRRVAVAHDYPLAEFTIMVRARAR